jgi:NarL family two-component system sensor histidine kinase YdfH
MRTFFFRKTTSENDLQTFQEELRGTRPFFLIFSFVLIAMYVFAFYSDATLLKPTKLIPLVLLGIVHGALYWFSPHLTVNRRWMVPYFLVQGIILFTINLIAQNQGILLGLYLALSGAAVGIIEDFRKGIIPVAAYTILASANQVLAWGWGSLFGWLILFAPMMFFVVVYVVMFTRETQSRRRTQQLLKELEAAHQQLSEYATKVEELTLSAERQRMARELHDTLAQGLAGLILQLEAVDSHLGQDHFEQAQAIVHQAMGRARVTLADARRAIKNLRDETPSTENLSDALRQEVDRFTTATGIPCELELSPPNRIPTNVHEHARRALAEGLTNIARHAQANNVWLKLRESEGMLEITLRDDGMGFDPRTVAETSGHYGLVGLRERARLAGGSLMVISEPGAGTTLTLVLPLEDGAAEP